MRFALFPILLACTIPGLDAALPPPRPNIVYILADDLGYGDLSCYGQKMFQTPNLDRLALEGLRFTRHYAGSTVCAPSRSVLMTGLHTGHTPVRTNRDEPMPATTRTIAGLLKSAGYATGCFGKWGVGTTIPPRDPNEKGFDQFFGYVDMFHAHNLFPPFLVRNGEPEALRNGLVPGSDQGPWQGRGNGVAQYKRDYAPNLIVDEALTYIDDQAQRPFFLFLPLNTPHANNEGHARGRGMEVPDFGPFANRDWPDAEKAFARMVHDIDVAVGRIVAKLREHGLAERTLVIFTSDNGPHREGGHQADFFDSNGPLRGKKRDLYEGGVRVPCIAWWPGRVPAGTVTHHVSGFQDWLPTLCELANAKPPATDGISLVPTLTGPSAEQGKHEALYFEFHERTGAQAAVTDRWKAVRLQWLQDPEGPIELYDLSSDPGEEQNIAAGHPEIVGSLADFMRRSHTPHTRRPPEGRSSVTATGGALSRLPLWLNLAFRQDENDPDADSGIWWSWEDVQEHKPSIEVVYIHDGRRVVQVLQHGRDGSAWPQATYIKRSGRDTGKPGHREGHKHNLLPKKTVPRVAFLKGDLSHIPPSARIERVTLHLRLHRTEGLGLKIDQGVVGVYECTRDWNWDVMDWAHYDMGKSWDTPGGDFGPKVREIRIREDLLAHGWGKRSPETHFDFTDYVRSLQARRLASSPTGARTH